MSAADLQSEFALAATGLSWWLFTLPLLLGVGIETLVLVAADRWDRRRSLVAALALVAVSQLAMAAAPGIGWLSLAASVWMVAAGISTGVAEAALVQGTDGPDRAMARWGLFGALGDLCAPACFGALMAGGLGWRWALVLGGALAAGNALAVALGPALAPGADDDEEEEESSVLELLKNAATDPRLLAWLAAAAACTLLDEIFVAFASVRLRAGGVEALGQSAQMAAFALGGALGLWVTDRVLDRLGPDRVLKVACLGCTAGLLLWISSPWWVWACVLGAFTAPLWPLATAGAHEACRRPGIVAAVDRLFLPVEIGAPLLIGALADRFGLTVALAALLLQPLTVAAVTLAFGRVPTYVPGGPSREEPP